MIGLLAFLSFVAPESDLNVGSVIPWDKASHFSAYFGLTLVGLLAFPNLSLIVLSGGILTGSAIIEAAQPAAGRTFDLHDLLANGVGIAAVVACVIASNLRFAVRSRESEMRVDLTSEAS